jgi:MoxR-like ATPase
MSLINVPPRTPNDVIAAIEAAWNLDHTYMIWGPPGVGKSQAVRTLARKRGISLKDVRLATKTAADIGGLPALDHDNKKTTFFLPDFLPDPATDGPEGILFLDELPNADEQTRGAAYGLLLERQVSDYRVPDGWKIIAAGNRPEDGAISCDFGTALNDRIIHLLVMPEFSQWLQWGATAGLHGSVLAFIKTSPEFLMPTKEDLERNLVALPSPRSWERVSQIMQGVTHKSARKTLIYGTIGEAAGARFLTVANELEGMASIEALLAVDKDDVLSLLPTTLNGLWAMTYSMVAAIQKGEEHHKDLARILDICGMLDKIPSTTPLPLKDIQSLAFTLVTQRANDLWIDISAHPAFQAWHAERSRCMKAVA